MNTKQKDPTLLKNKIVPIRFTQTEYEIIKKYAGEAGFSLSEYIRQVLMEGHVSITYDVVVDMPEISDIARSLQGACNNLNQIAKYFHLGGLRSRQVLQEINACVRAIFEIRDRLAELEGEHIGHH